MTIRLYDETGEPLDPHAAETHADQFWAWRTGTYRVFRVIPNYPPNGTHDDWLIASGDDRRWGSSGLGEVARRGDVFTPYAPQGTPGTSQDALIYALERILPA